MADDDGLVLNIIDEPVIERVKKRKKERVSCQSINQLVQVLIFDDLNPDIWKQIRIQFLKYI